MTKYCELCVFVDWRYPLPLDNSLAAAATVRVHFCIASITIPGSCPVLTNNTCLIDGMDFNVPE